MRASERWKTFFICLMVSAGIIYLRLMADYPSELIKLTSNFLKTVEGTVIAFDLLEFLEFIKEIPYIIILFIVACIQITSGLLFLTIFKTPMEQGSMILIKKCSAVIKSGLSLYFGIAGIIGIFAYSIIGLPFAGALSLLSYIIISIGNIPLSIFIGYVVQEMLGVSGHTYIYYLFGSFIMIFCESVFGIGGAFLLFVFPVVSIGTVFVLFLNRIIYRISYDVEFQTNEYKEPFDREKIKGIIIKDTENKEK